MYKLKDDINIYTLRKYGFRPGFEWPDYKTILCNEDQYADFYLFPINEDGYIIQDDYCTPSWRIRIMKEDRIVDVSFFPDGVYYIDNCDAEECFATLFHMIKDGLIEEDFSKPRYFTCMRESGTISSVYLNDALKRYTTHLNKETGRYENREFMEHNTFDEAVEYYKEITTNTNACDFGIFSYQNGKWHGISIYGEVE